MAATAPEATVASAVIAPAVNGNGRVLAASLEG
jgi:hypothetical protein